MDKIAAWADSWATPAITICIPTKDRLDLLLPCLASLAYTCAAKPVDVLIGDTGSDTETLAFYARLGLPFVRIAGPFSFSRACNEMAAAASGGAYLFLNSDTEAVSADWVSRAVDSLNEAVIGAALIYPGTRRLQHAGVEAVRDAGRLHLNAYRPPRAHDRANLGIQNIGLGMRLEHLRLPTASVMGVTGAFLLTTQSQFEALNGFDESFHVDLQDIDYCLRARAKGIDVVCRRDIVFVHKHAASRGRYDFPLADWQLFVARWQGELERWSTARVPL